jgi:hypothetical protein
LNAFEIARALDLPQPLPEDEKLLWLGRPSFQAVARDVFHIPALSAYFAAVLAAHGVWLASHGAAPVAAAASTARLLPLAVAALAMFAFLAWMIARSSAYAITDRRVLMRIGVALSLTLNIPFRCIVSADLRLRRDGSGDLPLTLSGSEHMAYLNLWPHARPWHFRRTLPMMIGVPDAERVAGILGSALREHFGQTAQPLGRTAPATPGLPLDAGTPALA